MFIFMTSDDGKGIFVLLFLGYCSIMSDYTNLFQISVLRKANAKLLVRLKEEEESSVKVSIRLFLPVLSLHSRFLSAFLRSTRCN